MVGCGLNNTKLIKMKKELVIKFIEKLDYSYNYKTTNERDNIIKDICDIAGIEQLTIPPVVGQREQLDCCVCEDKGEYLDTNPKRYGMVTCKCKAN